MCCGVLGTGCGSALYSSIGNPRRKDETSGDPPDAVVVLAFSFTFSIRFNLLTTF